MSVRWIYAQDGTAAYYQQGEHIYSANGKHSFWVDNGWWYRVPDGQAAFYISNSDGKWVYSAQGQPSFYYGD